MTKASKLPKTQAAALELLIDGMTRDQWDATGANRNAQYALKDKGLVTMTAPTGMDDTYKPATFARA